MMLFMCTGVPTHPSFTNEPHLFTSLLLCLRYEHCVNGSTAFAVADAKDMLPVSQAALLAPSCGD